MVSLLTMTGGASLVGAWVYKRWEDKKQRHRSTDAGQTVGQSWSAASWQAMQTTLQQIRQRFARLSRLAAMKPTLDCLFICGLTFGQIGGTIGCPLLV